METSVCVLPVCFNKLIKTVVVQSAGHMYFSSVVTVDWALAGYA